MNKILKNILIAIIIVAVIWAIFVAIDSIRLRNSTYYTYPLIMLKQDANLERVKYTGLGYTISYIQNRTIEYHDDVSIQGIGASGAEFKLFDSWLLWAYIE